ncbi:MAG: hypothetical protein II767_01395 [Proteobacteria bacterium]|nr:hypothetical protein [Pseudomonadota bacterium]
MKRYLITALAAAMLQSCAWIDEVGQPDSKAEFRLEDAQSDDTALACPTIQFPLKFDFFDIDTPDESITTIGMYANYPDIMTSQYALITFVPTDAQTLEACPPPTELAGTTQPLTRDGCVRMAIQINACDPKITARVIGTLTLDAFSPERGKRVEGKVEGKVIYFEQVNTATETRERQTEIGTVEGEFSFVNHAGAVWNI